MPARQDPLETLQELLGTGFDIADVDSTEDELVLTLYGGDHHHTVVLDREAARRLVVDDLLHKRRILA